MAKTVRSVILERRHVLRLSTVQSNQAQPAHTNTDTHTHTHTQTHRYTNTHTQTHTHTHNHTHTHACTHARTHPHMHAHKLTIFILLALKAGVRTRLLFFHSSPLDEDTPSYILPWTRVTIMPRFSCEGENYKLLKSIIYVRTNKHKTKQDWDKLHSK